MLSKQQKKAIIDRLAKALKGAKSIVLTDFSGLTVKEIQGLRQDLKKAQAHYQVIKKTLLDLALKKAGINLKTKQFKGSVAIGLSANDGIVLAKILYNFARGHEKLRLLGGILTTPKQSILNQEQIIALAQIPGKEQLLGQLVATLASPLRNFGFILQANLRNFVSILKQKTIRNS